MQQQATVLVVDDDESIRKALCRLLGARGVLTRSFTSAEECLGAIQGSFGPACVIADLRLPGMSGAEFQRALPARYPFIMLTGFANVDAAVAAMQAGALDFLEKPIPHDRLFASVGNALSVAQQLHDQAQLLAHLRMKIDRLTPRELEVMGLVATGMRNKQIASQLGTVEKTIKVHRAHVMEKMELSSLVEIVRCADRLGIVADTEVPRSTPPTRRLL